MTTTTAPRKSSAAPAGAAASPVFSKASAPPPPAEAASAGDLGKAVLQGVVDGYTSALGMMLPTVGMADLDNAKGLVSCLSDLPAAVAGLERGEKVEVELKADVKLEAITGASLQGAMAVTRTDVAYVVETELRAGAFVGDEAEGVSGKGRALVGIKVEHDEASQLGVAARLAKNVAAMVPLTGMLTPSAGVAMLARDARSVEAQFRLEGEVAVLLKEHQVGRTQLELEGKIGAEGTVAVRVEHKADGSAEAVVETRVKVEGGFDGKAFQAALAKGGEVELVDRATYALPRGWELGDATDLAKVLKDGKPEGTCAEIVLTGPGAVARAEVEGMSSERLLRALRGDIVLPESAHFRAEVQQLATLKVGFEPHAAFAHIELEAARTRPIGKPVEVTDPANVARRFLATQALGVNLADRLVGR